MFLSRSVSFQDKDITHNATQFGPITTVHSNNKAASSPRKSTGTSNFPLRLPGAIEAAGVSSLNKEPSPSVFTLIKKNKGFLGTITTKRRKKKSCRLKSSKASHLNLSIESENKGVGSICKVVQKSQQLLQLHISFHVSEMLFHLGLFSVTLFVLLLLFLLSYVEKEVPDHQQTKKSVRGRGF